MADDIAYNIGSLPALPSGTLLDTDLVEIERPSGVPGTPNENYRMTAAQLRAALAGDSAKTGDMLLTARAPGAGWLDTGVVYSQANYPELFALVGAVPDSPPGAIFSVVNIATGDIRAVNKYARINSNKIIGVGANRTMWLSYDNGRTWTSKTVASSYPTFTYVAMTSVGLFVGTNQGTVLRSNDEGETFVELPQIQSLQVGSIAESDGRVFVSMAGGNTFRADDAGTSLSPNWDILPTGSLIAVVSFGYGIVLGVSVNNSNAYRSTDNGTNWQTIATGVTFGTTYGNDIVQVQDNVMVAIDKNGYVVRSENYGINFTAVLTVGAWLSQVRRYGDRLYAISTSAAVGGYHYYSDDFGKTWVNSGALGDGTRVVFLEDAFGISLYRQNGITNLQRSSPIYDYDETTQFRTPRVDGLRGVKGYVKP